MGLLSVADEELAVAIDEREGKSATPPGPARRVELLDVADDVIDRVLSPNPVEFLVRTKQSAGE